MSNPIIKEHNISTGEIIEREMNKSELDQLKADIALAIVQGQEAKAKATEKAALLAKLGITADEAGLLLS
jgi:hypothetical protein